MKRLSAKSGSTPMPWRPSSSCAYTSSLPASLVFPAASVRRSSPSREVCRTERSGRTASDMGSPTSASPLARVTCWKSSAATALSATAGGATRVREAPASSAPLSSATVLRKIRRRLWISVLSWPVVRSFACTKCLQKGAGCTCGCLAPGCAVTPETCGGAQLPNAASNEADGGSKSYAFRRVSASGAPWSRSIPASSHSTETGPW